MAEEFSVSAPLKAQRKAEIPPVFRLEKERKKAECDYASA
jgi:hypothetical protein